MKILAFLSIALLTIILIGNSSSQFVDNEVRFGLTFQNTDSLKLRTGGVKSALKNEVLYSDFLMNDQSDEGIWNVAVYNDSLSGASATVKLDVRLGDAFKWGSGSSMFGGGRDSTIVKWGPWKTVFPVIAIKTLYKKTITPADSSWFMPSSGVQFRLTEADADTSRPHVKQYKR